MLILFIVAAALTFYVFLGYPLLLLPIAALFARPVKKGAYEPSVSLLISAYNEVSVIKEKIHNSFGLRYPKEKLEIIVCSDGSTDGTDEIVESFGDRVRLVRVEGRKGKTECQNQGVRAATGEIVVFSDANSLYDADAITELVKNLKDESVGVVCGELRYTHNAKSDEGLYWKLERSLKHGESALGSCLGANGSIYAIRRNLYRELPADACSDFIEPFKVYEQGYRVVYESDAFCVETPGENALEFMRKHRIISSSLQSLYLIKKFLNPLRFGWYSIALWSHKVLRWLAFIFVALVFIANVFLLDHLFFQILFTLQCCFYICAVLGIFLRYKLFSVPYYFSAVNVASFLGFLDWIFRRKITAWEKVR